MDSPRRGLIIASTGWIVASALGCASSPPPATVAETVARMPELATLRRMLDDAGLTATLAGAGPFTLFAPTEEAFKAMPAKTRDDLAANKELLKSVLLFHVLPSRVLSTDAKAGNVKTAQGADLSLTRAGAFLAVDEAVVQKADVLAANGVVHIIDRVLIPPRAR